MGDAQSKLKRHRERQEQRRQQRREAREKRLKQLQKKNAEKRLLQQQQQRGEQSSDETVLDTLEDDHQYDPIRDSLIDDDMLSAVGIPTVPAGYRMGQRQQYEFNDTASMVSRASSVLHFTPLSHYSTTGLMQRRMLHRRQQQQQQQNQLTRKQEQQMSPAAMSLAQFGIHTQHTPYTERSKRHRLPARVIAAQSEQLSSVGSLPKRAYSVYDFDPALSQRNRLRDMHDDDYDGFHGGNVADQPQASLRSLARAHQPPTRIRSIDRHGRLLQRRRTSGIEDTFSDHSSDSEVDSETEMELLEEAYHQRQKIREQSNLSLPLGIDIDDILSNKGIKIKTYLCYNGNASIDVEFELTVNVPTPGFVSMPMSFTVTHLHIEGELVIIYQDDAVRVYFERPKRRPYSPLKDFELTVKMGNEQQEGGKSLVDKSVVGEFVKSQIQSVLEKYIVFPHVFTLPNLRNDVLSKLIPATKQES